MDMWRVTCESGSLRNWRPAACRRGPGRSAHLTFEQMEALAEKIVKDSSRDFYARVVKNWQSTNFFFQRHNNQRKAAIQRAGLSLAAAFAGRERTGSSPSSASRCLADGRLAVLPLQAPLPD